MAEVVLWSIILISIFTIAHGINDQNDLASEESKNDPGELLLLTPLIEAGKMKEAQDAAAVTKISELKGMKSYSGYLTVNEKHNSHMFFWFFPSQRDPDNAPLILWLQGGPGRSSLRGLFIENGPFDIGNGTLVKRDATWTHDHSVIYLDNPVGAGFSDSDEYHTNLTTLSEDLYNAILQFLQLFPNYQKNDFYIAGQSYGGKYVPTIAHLIHTRQSKHKINLVGIAIGNGLVDPETQFHYSEYLYQIGLINLKGKIEFESREKEMVKQIQNKDWMLAHSTYADILLSAGDTIFKNNTGYQNMFNMLEPTLSSEKEIHMSEYVSQPEIRRAIHAGNNTFAAYYGYLQYLLREEVMQSVAPLISDLLNNYKVLLYNGQLDILIPYRSAVDYIKKLKFKDGKKYDDAERYKWFVNGTLAGYATQVGNLIEVMVRNAGHSVTEDQIVWATDMIYRFTRNLSFDTGKSTNA